jgi:hypothetical protein
MSGAFVLTIVIWLAKETKGTRTTIFELMNQNKVEIYSGLLSNRLSLSGLLRDINPITRKHKSLRGARPKKQWR